MHAKFTEGELIVGLIAAAIIVWFVLAILRWVDSLFASKPVQEIPAEDELETALKIASAPRPVAGTKQWMHYECKPVFCDAPIVQGDITVHNRKDPEHLAQCAECREGLKFRGSGVSYRSN